MRLIRYLVFALATTVFPVTSFAGRIFVNHDEWTTTNFGYTSAGPVNAGQFVENLAAFMNIGGGSGNFLIYASNLSLNQSDFLDTLDTAGHTVTQDTTGATPFTLAALSAFDGIFMAGNNFSMDEQVLTDYVNGGGSVYIAGGTNDWLSAALEAAAWNGFLDDFGLAFATEFNSVTGNDSVTGTHSTLSNVSTLYYAGGNAIVLTGGNPNASIVEVSLFGDQLLGVFDDTPAAVPEPGTFALLAAALTASVWLRRRKTV
jgi:hypothetical protein